MTLLAAFKVLLYRYTGEEDIIVGTPVAGRDRSEIENLIGIFINTLVFRGNINGKETFRELLSRVRQVALEAYEHQDLPFEKLVEELQPDRDLSHTPVFQVLFQLRNLPTSTLTAGDIALKEVKFERGIAAFDLTLDIVETSQGLVCSFEYNADLFEAATIERMAGHFQVLLSGIAVNPEQPVYQLPLLTEPEKHQLLVEWNDTATDYPQDKCIHQLFEEQVELTPDAVAVVFESEQLTYSQLNSRANQLAHYLRDLGVGPEVLVGICVERSLEMVVGLLGILKAGGAYVPLDPNYPQERLTYMLSDSEIEILLTKQELLSSLPSSTIQKVCLDRDWNLIELQSQSNLNVGLSSDNLAYVIYTSGSTGQPKGVLVEHNALVNHCQSIQSVYYLKPSDRVLQFASANFDPFIEQTIVPLTVGAGVVVRNEELLQAWQFQEQIDKYGISVINLPPAYWQQVIQQWVNGTELALKDSLRLVIIGGDAMPPEAVKREHLIFPKILFFC
jgi:non-ribosomal peptide synthetase component F